MKPLKNKIYSKYWLDDLIYDDDVSYNTSIKHNYGSIDDISLLKMVVARRAVSNYVWITTNKKIPVYFQGDSSYTSGESIVISANVTNIKEFDVNVGLALHESHHIIYSDFELLENIWMHIPNSIQNYATKFNVLKSDLIELCMLILNYIEDRFIDKISYIKNVGYRPYYIALYNKYFNTKVISDALASDMYRELSTESYLFRIVNFTNVNSDLTALPNLKLIYDKIDFKNITRLKTPYDRLNCALDVLEIIFSSIDDFSKKSNLSNRGNIGGPGMPSNNDGDNGENDSESNNSDSNDDNDLDPFQSISDLLDGDTTQNQSSSNNSICDINNIGKDDSLSKSKITRINNSFKNQKDLLSGKARKKKVLGSTLKTLKQLEESDVEIVNVGKQFFKDYYKQNKFTYENDPFVQCVVYKKITVDHIKSKMITTPKYIIAKNEETISDGISLGIKLGKQLQIRNQEIIEKYTHKKTGKLDKRLLYSAGYGSEDVFYTTNTIKYKETFFHIDVDVSSSMGDGGKWKKTLKLLVAISKAITMLFNVRLRIAFRFCMSSSKSNPMYIVAFDSKYDNFSKLKDCLKYIFPQGTTPEGLCFEAGMKLLENVDKNYNNIFINISDGEPFVWDLPDDANGNYTRFEDEIANEYTKKQVDKIRNLGYSIISYYIESNNSDFMSHLVGLGRDSKRNFRHMYGKDSQFVDVNSLNALLNTFNNTLLETYTITHY